MIVRGEGDQYHSRIAHLRRFPTLLTIYVNFMHTLSLMSVFKSIA